MGDGGEDKSGKEEDKDTEKEKEKEEIHAKADEKIGAVLEDDRSDKEKKDGLDSIIEDLDSSDVDDDIKQEIREKLEKHYQEIDEKVAKEFLELIQEKEKEEEIKAAYDKLDLYEKDKVWQIATDEQKEKLSFIKSNNK